MRDGRPPLRIALFDFDYTLADSSRGAVECINFALGGLGLPLASPAAICQTIGLALPETLVQLAGPAQRPRSEEFTRLFVQRANEVMVSLTVIYPTVAGTVQWLRQQGVRLGIVSTKYRFRIATTLKRAGLGAAFDLIVGGEDVTRHKPEPDGLLRALASLQGRPEETLYVGDNTVDAEAARRASVSFVAVLTGMTPKSAFAGYPVAGIIDQLDELITWWST